MARISVITPFYNPTLDDWNRSSRSILDQTNKDFEWILVNDGSTDLEIPFDYDVSLERNYGPSVARNIGFQISSGDVITYLDMGDELAPDRVEHLIKLFDSYRIQLSFSGYNIVQGNNEQTFNPFNWVGNTMSAVDYINLLKKQNISIPMGVAHTRKPFVEVGGFQRGIVCGEDGILWRRMVDKILPTEIMITDDVAGTYFISENGQSRSQRRFEMGGFAFDGSRNDNGRYLDEDWFREYRSDSYYE